MKILIAVPTFENIAPETFKSIYGLQSEHTLAFDYIKGYDCATARNKIVQAAAEGEFDYVFMVDSDIVLPYDCLDYLSQDLPDICVGIYPRKGTSEQQTELFKFTEKDFTERFTLSELEEYKNNNYDRIQVKGSGMGCALIKMDVFKKLQFPYFKYVQYESGDVLSEDLYFCDLARKNGFDIVADLRVKCGHINKVIKYN